MHKPWLQKTMGLMHDTHLGATTPAVGLYPGHTANIISSFMCSGLADGMQQWCSVPAGCPHRYPPSCTHLLCECTFAMGPAANKAKFSSYTWG
jgi:hypothetical protein